MTAFKEVYIQIQQCYPTKFNESWYQSLLQIDVLYNDCYKNIEFLADKVHDKSAVLLFWGHAVYYETFIVTR